MIKWYYFPKSDEIPEHLKEVVKVFEKNQKTIESPDHTLKSNEVLTVIREDLEAIYFNVENKADNYIIKIPVLFKECGKIEKSFNPDAYNNNTQTVIEVEAGRAVANNQFLKDLFQACVMLNVKYLVTAVRTEYRKSKDFKEVIKFYNTLYSSNRLNLPLKGVLIIGY